MNIDNNLVKDAKDKLGAEGNFERIMTLLGVEEYDSVRLKCKCPFHTEDTASFIMNPRTMTMHCFGCGKNTDIIDAYMSGRNASYIEAVKYLFDEADTNFMFDTGAPNVKREYRFPHDEDAISGAALKYVQARGISESVARYVGLQADAHGNVVFPYRDQNDVLLTVKYRPPRKVIKGENKTWCQGEADTTPILFNMNKINTSQPLLITEGEFDCLAAITAGWQNATSVPFGAGNLHWIDQCYDWLEQFDTIIIMSDNDEPGQKMKAECIHRLGSYRTKFVNIPERITDKNTGESHNVKDANEILFYAGPEALLELIRNASESPIENAVDYTEVPDVDIGDMEGIITGFSPLDKLIRRLYYGTLTILSGTPGSGKSSLLFQLACNVMDKDIPVFIYSGEMQNSLSRSWTNSILAGPRYAEMHVDTENDSVYYTVPTETKKAINKRYGDLCFFYDDAGSNDANSILTTTEMLIRRKGVKLIILDNLAVIHLTDKEAETNRAQTEFVSDLIKLASKYKVSIILCAHPRKLMMGEEVSLYSPSGSANLANLCHMMLAIRRVRDDERNGIRNKSDTAWVKPPFDYDVKLSIIKDRLSGRAGIDIGLYYDNKGSRRFFWDDCSYRHQYSWDTNTYDSDVAAPVKNQIDKAFG